MKSLHGVKILHDSSQTRATHASSGATMPLSGAEPDFFQMLMPGPELDVPRPVERPRVSLLKSLLKGKRPEVVTHPKPLLLL